MILWGMGISQHVHGTDNARCLIALALMTGQIGRPGTGLHPLRGQNNVQGASDAGLIPMMYPDYQHVVEPGGARALRERLAACARHARRQAGPDGGRGDARDQAWRDPRHVRHGREPRHVRPRRQPCARIAGRARSPGGAGHLPDRDRLPGRRDPAGQRLPREDRQLHQHRPAGADGPPGDRSAGRRQAGPVDHPGDRAPRRPGLAVQACVRSVRRDAPHHAQHRRHHLGPAGTRACRHLSVREGRRPRPVGGVRRGLPARSRPRPLRAGRHHSRPTSARTRSTRWC